MPDLFKGANHSKCQEAFEIQRDFFAQGTTLPIDFREAALNRLLENLGEREDEFLDCLNSDLGKPALEGWLSEVHFIRTELRLILSKLETWLRPVRAGNPFFIQPARSYIAREPFGTALVIAPWNYPLQLALGPAIAAIAAGNCVTIKPSEHSPATSDALARLIADSFQPGHATVIQGGSETSTALLDQPYNHFFFTGGERVGRIVAAAAARHLAPCVLELGGKCPAIIHESAAIEPCVERIATGKFFNAGQTCLAPDFVALPEPLLEPFLSQLESFMLATYAPHPEDLAHCPHEAHRDRILSLAPSDAHQAGTDDGLRLAPRWARVEWDSPAMREEIFGPFLPIVTYTDPEEVIGRIAKMPSPLALYIFTRDQEFERKALARISSGSVCINDVMKQGINLQLPFGGVGPSGHGRYRGKHGIETFSYTRPVTRRFFLPDLFAAKPPYADLFARLRRWMK
ncbi:aldehyde dehydrogenase family protein [Haloferula sp.]|uniref:aldehyde dehydrogenase family protein n=1 Tax=Haloferula sp. TaxID=2497595 RepID=UPI00329F706A